MFFTKIKVEKLRRFIINVYNMMTLWVITFSSIL